VSGQPVKIARFEPVVAVVHKHSTAYRRITIRGEDGLKYHFLVQLLRWPSHQRQSRAELRILQLYRMLNPLLDRRKETRKRCVAWRGALSTGC
jgi:transformation/transcription domain-associated protein